MGTPPLEHSIHFGGEIVQFTVERTFRLKTVAIAVGYNGVRVLASADLERPLCYVPKSFARRGPGFSR